MAFVPPLAPIVVLAFLGAILAVALSLLATVVGLIARRRLVLRAAAATAGAMVALYGLTLAGFSLASRERTLRPGEEKAFCEIDCHLACTVMSAKVVPSPTPGVEPDGLVVTVRTRFDEKTISPQRGAAPLAPNPRRVFLEEPNGRRIAPLALTAGGAPGGLAPLTTALRPGESYLTDVTFALPSDPQRCRLFVGSDDGDPKVLIGHENSPLHPKAWFALPTVAKVGTSG